MIDLIPKWTRVTVYNSIDWEDEERPTVQYEGFLVDSTSDSVFQILTDKGRLKRSVNSEIVQINMNNDIITPRNGSELIPEGTDVVCSEYDDDSNKVGDKVGKFVRFGLDYNDEHGDVASFTAAVVLLSDGEVELFPVDNIRVLPVSSPKKENNSIIKRLKSII